MIAAGVLLAAPLLLETFGFAGALAGLSFLIWGQPFLVWFVDGYYSTTPAMVCQLILAAWCVAFAGLGILFWMRHERARASRTWVFVDYPFVTAHLRRPLLRFESPASLMKEETSEDAAPALRVRGGDVYIALRSLSA